MTQRRTRKRRTVHTRAVIFDFDGTIADSFDYVFNFLKGEAKNTREFTASELKELRKMSMKRLAFHLGVPVWKGPFVYFKGRRMMRAHMGQVQAFTGMPEAIRELHEAGWSLFVASSNSSRNIRQLLRRYDLLQYVTAVDGNIGVSKAAQIRRLMMRARLSRETTWYVGDETRDVVAAAGAGIGCVAVGWGFADAKDLKMMDPAAYAARPTELVKTLEKVWKKQ